MEILGPPCSPSRNTFLLSLRVLARSRQVLGKFLAFLSVLGCGRGIFWPKALPKPSQNPPQSLQNRPWRRPRRYLPKTLNLRRLPSRLPYSRRSHFEPIPLKAPKGAHRRLPTLARPLRKARAEKKGAPGKRSVPHLKSSAAKCGKPYQRRRECIPTIVSRRVYMWGS